VRTNVLGAFWPAMLGVLAAHQLAYAGHDDGHLHSYLATFGPAVVVATVLGWIWTWARARVDFRTVLVLQAGLFALMETSERLAGPAGFEFSDLTPVAIALALLPLVAAVAVFADRIVERISSHDRRTVWDGAGQVAPEAARPRLLSGSVAAWSIRAPPSLA
jgi:hypothetical protein